MSVKVSVCITAYNHERFIEKCIQSVLDQKTQFEFEILVGDDGSSDKTAEIIRSIEQKNPNIIRAFYHDRSNIFYFNGHPTGQNNNLNNLIKSNGEYIALLDGDDYWTDPNKLQTQVDYLEGNKQCAGCFHNSVQIDDEGEIINDRYFNPPKETVFNQEEVLKNLKSSYHTGSLVFRSEILRNMPEWFKKRIVDSSIDLLVTQHGTLDYIDMTMSAYRFHQGGVWSGKKLVTNLYDRFLRYKILYDDKEINRKFGKYLRLQMTTLLQEVAWSYRKNGDLKLARKAYFKYLIYNRPIRLKNIKTFILSFIFNR